MNMTLAREKFSYIIQRPSGVCLGRKISRINEKIIVDMAKEIPVYKMDFNENSRNYKLKKCRII